MHEYKCPQCGELSYSAATLDRLRDKNCAECGAEVKEVERNATGAKLECIGRPKAGPCDLPRSGRGGCRPGTNNLVAVAWNLYALLNSRGG